MTTFSRLSVSLSISVAAAAVLALVGVLTGCAPHDTSDSSSSALISPEQQAAVPLPTATPDAAPSSGSEVQTTTRAQFEAALAEREAFFADQRFSLDGTLPSAQTEAQRAFIDAQRSHVESLGLEWSDADEGVALGLAAVACEISILSGHAPSSTAFTDYGEESILIRSIVDDLPEAEQAEATRNLLDLAAFGTSFLCPSDAPWWRAQFVRVYG